MDPNGAKGWHKDPPWQGPYKWYQPLRYLYPVTHQAAPQRCYTSLTDTGGSGPAQGTGKRGVAGASTIRGSTPLGAPQSDTWQGAPSRRRVLSDQVAKLPGRSPCKPAVSSVLHFWE